ARALRVQGAQAGLPALRDPRSVSLQAQDAGGVATPRHGPAGGARPTTRLALVGIRALIVTSAGVGRASPAGPTSIRRDRRRASTRCGSGGIRPTADRRTPAPAPAASVD